MRTGNIRLAMLPLVSFTLSEPIAAYEVDERRNSCCYKVLGIAIGLRYKWGMTIKLFSRLPSDKLHVMGLQQSVMRIFIKIRWTHHPLSGLQFFLQVGPNSVTQPSYIVFLTVGDKRYRVRSPK